MLRCISAVLLLVAMGHPQTQSHPSRTSDHLAAPSTVPQEAAWNKLATAVLDRDSMKRQKAVDALSTLGGLRKAVGMVELRLGSDKSAAVRGDAAMALAEMKSRRSIGLMRKALDDESEQVQFAAAQALWQLGDHSGRALLVEVLEGETTPSDGMLRQGFHDARRTLRNPRSLVLTGINQASSALLGPFSFGIRMAEQLAKDKSAPARALSASLLAFDHHPESIRRLQAALHDKSSLVRLAAAKALGQHPCQHIVPDLLNVLDSDKDEVKYMAAASILKIVEKSNSASPKAECELPDHDVAISSRAAGSSPRRE